MPKKQISIPVRAFVEMTQRSGDLHAGFMQRINPIEAIRAHQIIQKSRPPSYRSEVAVAYRYESADHVLTLQGRIDGLLEKGDSVVIEEIKTTTRNLAEIVQTENQLHWGQAKCYAFIYASEKELACVTVRLTYYHIDTNQIREVEKVFTLEELAAFFQQAVSLFLTWSAARSAWINKRNHAIASLSFPFPFRKGQREMAAAMYVSIKRKEKIFIEAPTGIGKSLAAVFASVKALGEGLADRIFYLTARSTGKQAAENALGLLRRAGLAVRSVTLTAKDKICFSFDAVCTPEECSFAKGHYDRIGGAIRQAFADEALDAATIRRIAHQHHVCPFELSLDVTLFADVVIGDYNYAFDPRVYLRRHFDDSFDSAAFLVDEAHNLVDRSRSMFSAGMEKEPLLVLRRLIGTHRKELYLALGALNRWFLKVKKSSLALGQDRYETDPPHSLRRPVRRAIAAIEQWLQLDEKTAFRDTLIKRYFELNAFLRVLERYDETYATCYTCRDANVIVTLMCIDPAPQLKEALRRCDSAAFFSATLKPASYFKDLFGCARECRDYSFASPFSRNCSRHLIAGSISTLYHDRRRSAGDIARLIHAVAVARDGNYLAFFPSYHYLQLVHEHFCRMNGDVRVLVQRAGFSEQERSAFLDEFTDACNGSLVGFSVLGGVFGEGIDLVGDRLSGVIISGIGLPGLGAPREAIRAYYQRKEGRGFEFAYLLPGWHKVVQAAGRVIRTGRDKGIVLLIDQRYREERYRALFPSFWNTDYVSNSNQLGDRLSLFWQRPGEAVRTTGE
ncbi:MAG: ATP-dependent DNA helicase [Chitinivibrionales bacterium]|nr:ATP-dependent DNA helicase [Chitinivibrionales bacterium]